MPNRPSLKDIESDPVLAGTKLIAEAWDAAGVDQVGASSASSWKEWNGRFRDDVRSFVRGDNGSIGHRRSPTACSASPDALRAQASREAETQCQFRHLPRWVHAQRSGVLQPETQPTRTAKTIATARLTTGAGIAASKGPTDDPDIEALRNRQVKNLPDSSRCCHWAFR